MVLNSFSTVKTLGWRYICLLRPRTNGLMFQCLDLSPIFSFLCLLQFWKHIFLHFLFLVHWCFHQSWIISQTKQKEQDFGVQVFWLICLFWEEMSHTWWVYFSPFIVEGGLRTTSDIGVEMDKMITTVLGYLGDYPSLHICVYRICSLITSEDSRSQELGEQ